MVNYHPQLLKKVVSYLPDTTYLSENIKISDAISYFQDFYSDFNVQRAYQLLNDLHLHPNQKLNSLSKGNKEKSTIDFGDES